MRVSRTRPGLVGVNVTGYCLHSTWMLRYELHLRPLSQRILAQHFPGLMSPGDHGPRFQSWASQLSRTATLAPGHVMSPVARVMVFSFQAMQSSRTHLWCCLVQEVPHFSFLLWENVQRIKNNKF